MVRENLSFKQFFLELKVEGINFASDFSSVAVWTGFVPSSLRSALNVVFLKSPPSEKTDDWDLLQEQWARLFQRTMNLSIGIFQYH